jgi:hypothetical protein
MYTIDIYGERASTSPSVVVADIEEVDYTAGALVLRWQDSEKRERHTAYPWHTVRYVKVREQ